MKASGGGRVDDRSRVFKVLKEHVPLEQTPLPLQQLLGYEFFTIDPSSGNPQELGLDQSNAPSEQSYWLKVDDLAHDRGRSPGAFRSWSVAGSSPPVEDCLSG